MGKDRVTLTVPARGEYARTVRMTAAELAARIGMSYDEVDDVRMAAEEAFVYAVDHADDTSEIELRFDLTEEDISIRVDRIDPALLIGRDRDDGTTADARVRVMNARAYGQSRDGRDVRRTLDRPARAMLEAAARTMSLSGRAVTRLVRVARTIADMAESAQITEAQVSEALGYRSWEYR